MIEYLFNLWNTFFNSCSQLMSRLSYQITIPIIGTTTIFEIIFGSALGAFIIITVVKWVKNIVF